VVLLLSWDSDDPVGTLGSCTAEVIAPDVLLTAAHCLDSDRENHAAYLGDDGNQLGRPVDPGEATVRAQLHMVRQAHPHPDHRPGPTSGYHDIGVVILQNRLTSVPVLPINRAPLGGATLKDLTIVGYGKTHDRDTTFAITKYRADGLSATLDPTETITVGDAVKHACVGDSGGPVFAQINGVRTIIGVDSYSDETGDATRCRMASHYQRVDPYLDFVDQYVPPGGTGGSAGAGGAGAAGGAGGNPGSGGAGGLGASGGAGGQGGSGAAAGGNSGGTAGAAWGGAGSGGTAGIGGFVGTGGAGGIGGGAAGWFGGAGVGGGAVNQEASEDEGCTIATHRPRPSVSGVLGLGLLTASVVRRRRARR
jgi:hypothetical protein